MGRGRRKQLQTEQIHIFIQLAKKCVCRPAPSNGSADAGDNAKQAQVQYNWQNSALKASFDRDPQARKELSRFFALDVECVAVGKVGCRQMNPSFWRIKCISS